jgi:hypothetical protein
MKPSDVHEVLDSLGVTHLHHANTVTTSSTFLDHGGLLSRRYVEKHGLPQTPQSSDQLDKDFGIWDRVFVDHVDIHFRGGRKKGPNQYGPVLFVFQLDLLLQLPKGSKVLVTKTNPVHWSRSDKDNERWFRTPEELSAKLSKGDFDKMLVIETADGKVAFPSDAPVRIALDNPKRKMISGADAFDHAQRRLRTAAKVGGVNVSIEEHVCRDDCICLDKYKAYDAQWFDSRFA